MMLDRKLLVVGCGHSGTMYMAHLLQKIGLDIPHERPVGRDGIVRWSYTHLYKDELQNPVFRGEEHNEDFLLPDDVMVMHLVRHPLKVIASVTQLTDGIWEFVGARAKHHGVSWNPLDNPHPLRGMRLWLLWNLFAEELADFRYRVEELPEIFPELLEKLGLPSMSMPDIPKDTNTHNPTLSYSWDDLNDADGILCYQIMRMAERYGYTD